MPRPTRPVPFRATVTVSRCPTRSPTDLRGATKVTAAESRSQEGLTRPKLRIRSATATVLAVSSKRDRDRF
jgi:hypothetical protein